MPSRPRARGIRLPAWSATSRNGDFPLSLYTETGGGSSAASNPLGSTIIDAQYCGKACLISGPKNACCGELRPQCTSPESRLYWNTMPILSIRHVTTYHYNKPIAFGEHRMMLRPRDDGDQKVLESEIEITPAPLQLTWSQDIFGNHVAIAHFDDRKAELCIVSNSRLEHAPTGFDEADIDESARFYPFAYAAEDWLELKRFTRPPAARREIDRGSAAFFGADRSVGTHELLVGMTHAIRRSFKHVSRHQNGVQDPVRTLELGSGSCRDLAVLMIAALR